VSAETPEDADRQRSTIAVVSIVAALVVVVLVALWVNRDADGDPTALPSPETTQEPTEEQTPTEAAPTSEPAAEPTEAATPQPTQQDAAAFADEHGPVEQQATADIDEDGTPEVVVARVRNDTTHIVVGRWDGQRYQEVFRDDGGSADQVDGLDVQDYNGEPGLEVVTLESVGEDGESLTVWGFNGTQIVRQEADGGCWDGFHHYGISGATIEPGRIEATCDGSPLPEEGWTSDIYEWTDGAWTYVGTEQPGT
jgi:hypothetical protein